MAVDKLKKWLYTLLFPHKCFLCGRVLPDEGWQCDDCTLPVVRAGSLCPRCGQPLVECVCAVLSPAFIGALAPLYYVDGVRRGIFRFKYNGRSYYAAFLGAQIYEAVMREWSGIAFDCVSYVPMHAKKRRSRGYCPAELLAREVARHMQLPVQDEMICHTGNKQAQMTQKGMQARLENAGRSFAPLPEGKLAGERVLLIDDVLTTGATVQACAQLLLALGAGEVWVATAATTMQRTKQMQ